VTLTELIAAARAKVDAMSGDEYRDMVREQRVDWTYGQLACTNNHHPTREAFRAFCLETIGWSEERFEAWAVGKEWRDV
jgi:hypothetical protein